MAKAKHSFLKIEGREVPVSNLDKVFYPKTGFTKADVIDYYVRIAPVLLPHLKNRPLTMKRYPDGVDGPFFYEKKCPPYRPSWVETAKVWSKHNEKHIYYCVVNNLPSLVWAANLADLELHTLLSRYPKVLQPTMLVFDLDPGAPADILNCAELALVIEKLLARLKLSSFIKSSGSKGLQLYVPLNATTDFDQTGAFAKAVAVFLENRFPDQVVSKMTKSLRKGKVFVDWSQNDEHKTTVSVYSLRAKDTPTVSAPLTWAEVRKAIKSGRGSDLMMESDEVLRRVKKKGDLFEPILKLKQKLPKNPQFKV